MFWMSASRSKHLKADFPVSASSSPQAVSYGQFVDDQVGLRRIDLKLLAQVADRDPQILDALAVHQSPRIT